MGNILILSGSPSQSSKSSAIGDWIGERLEKEGNQFRHIKIRNLPAEDLIYSKFDSPAIQQARSLVEAADAIVVVSPVYKASYTGILKAFFDLLPEKAFVGKPVLPIINGGTAAHLLSVEYAFKPLFSVLGATNIIHGVFIDDSQVRYSETELLFLSNEVEQRLRTNIEALTNK
ncbi:MAG TPA: NADPH-dependent FMN reductase [Chondromyces sp.]|nr:NADPH-dependent FMN reductase [Chondromyces sp.]